MKKKLISLVLAGAMLLGMAGCAEKPGASEEGKKEDNGSKYELALITDVGTSAFCSGNILQCAIWKNKALPPLSHHFSI